MLDRYYSSHHHQQQQSTRMPASTPFSLFVPLPNSKVHQYWPDEEDDHSSITTSPSSPSSSSAGSVDCTLSLGTPSSRRAPAAGEYSSSVPDLTVTNKHVARHPSSVSWDDVAAADHHQSSYYYCRQQGGRPAGGGGAANKGAAAAHDAFADRRCVNCGTSSTPLWRNGPRGPKSLCNACGIRFKKEERRAAATAAMESGGGGCGYSAQRAQYEYAAAVVKASPGAVSSYGEGAFPCGGGGDADANAPFLAWRMNVVAPAPAPAFAAVWPERTSLFQYN